VEGFSSTADDDPAMALRRLVNGYYASQALSVVATLGIADLLAEGPRTSDDLATATNTDPSALYRVLRALAAEGVFTEGDNRQFDLTPVGYHLRSDADPSLQAWTAFVGRPYQWKAWTRLVDSVRTGENAFRLAHGMGSWDYRAAHPEESAIFDRAMVSLTSQFSAAIVAAYDFSRFRRVVDVGGGHGALVADVLRANPETRGVLFDQPHVVAHAAELLSEMGVDDRCEVVGGSFFDQVPGGGDAYILKSVVHDWNDEESVRILTVCRSAMHADAVLLVMERLIAPPNLGADDKLSDLNMLVGPGGRERTIEEFDDLLEQGGFRLRQVVATGSPMRVLEAAPA
jgi:O-methyltransferase domain/Dimerisation domain